MMLQSDKIRIIILVLVVVSAYITFSCRDFGRTQKFKIKTFTEPKEVDEKIIQQYQQQAIQRSEYLKNGVKEKGYYVLYNILVPEVFCIDLIRIGGVGDGGKWICNPIKMLDWPKCSIYSLGVSDDPSFEESLQSFLNKKCNVRSVDRDDQSNATTERIRKINGQFKKAVIGGERNESGNIFTFKNLLTEFSDDRIDILKIDIEEAEFSIIEELMSTPVCQILIEIHGKNAEMTLKLLQTFSKNGYYLFSYEINGAFHYLCEYSFIHQSCFSLFNVKQIYGKYLS